MFAFCLDLIRHGPAVIPPGGLALGLLAAIGLSIRAIQAIGEARNER